MINEHDIKDMNPYLSDEQAKDVKGRITANDIQIAGDHYKQFKGMEPWDVITGWGLGYLDGTAVKYLARWKHKGGIEDLKKAAHFIQKAIEVQERFGGK